MGKYSDVIWKLAISTMDRQVFLRGVPQIESLSHILLCELYSMESYPREGRPEEQIRRTELSLG